MTAHDWERAADSIAEKIHCVAQAQYRKARSDRRRVEIIAEHMILMEKLGRFLREKQKQCQDKESHDAPDPHL